LRADVVALTHTLRRIVCLEEYLQQIGVADHRRVIDHEHHLGVPGAAAADFLVARIRRMAAGVADRRHPNAVAFPELALGAPEAAEPE
jgi:hypothetical protein